MHTCLCSWNLYVLRQRGTSDLYIADDDLRGKELASSCHRLHSDLL